MNGLRCMGLWIVALAFPAGSPDREVAFFRTGSPGRAESSKPREGKNSATPKEGTVSKFLEIRPKKVVVLTVEGALDRKVALRIKRTAQGLGPDAVLVLRINSSGGTLDAAAAIQTALLSTKARTVAFVDKRAVGHAALAALGCGLVAMAPGARWGAVEVNQYSGAGSISPKQLKSLVEAFRKAAKHTGKPDLLAVAMVDRGSEVQLSKGLSDRAEAGDREGLQGAKKGKVLWVGPSTAVSLRLAHLRVASLVGLRRALGLSAMEAEVDGKIHAPLELSGVSTDGIRVPRTRPVDPVKLLADARTVHVLKISGTIDLGLAPFVARVLKKLKGNDVAVLDIDTFGGRVDGAVKIRDALLKSKAKTIAFVNRRAISAGALISLACDLIVMTSGGSIGAATPVQISGGKMKPTSEKVVSYMRKEMKSTAEAKGRRGDLAEAMVDRDMEVKNIPAELKESISGLKKGKLLTLTTKEALQLGVADLEAETFELMMEKLELKGLPVRRPKINLAEKIARFLTGPMVSGLLLTIGLLGLILELYSPGFGVSGIIGLCCLILFFFGHMVVDLAGWGHIVLFGVGIILLGVELFVTPGFGVLGIGGVVLIVIALALALMGVKDLPGFKLAWDLGYATRALAVVFGAIVVTAVLAYLAVRYLPRMKFLSGLVLQVDKGGAVAAAEGRDEGIGRAEVQVGDRGVAVTVLRPAGKVRFGRRRVSVVAQGKSIPKGSEVEVIRKEMGTVVVRKV